MSEITIPPNSRPSYREQYDNLPNACVLLFEGGGEDLMLRVVERLGGGTVSVPVRLSAHSVLVRELGEKDAAKVWEIWRGPNGPAPGRSEFEVFIPTMATATRKARRARILSLRESGATVRSIARSLSITDRTVYNELAKAGRDGGGLSPTQLDLFA